MPTSEPARDGPRLARFFQEVERGGRRLLLLDYDGTLAPFREARDEAAPYDGVRPLLRTIVDAGHTRVVVISGRALDDLLPLLGLDDPPELWGSHGWERLRGDGTRELAELPPDAADVLGRAARAVDDAPFRGRVERKPSSVAVHWRGLGDEEARRLSDDARARWSGLAEASRTVELHPFDGGIELRVVGRDKGEAIRAILEEEPGDPVTAYLGDDLTDEDAFRALEGRGLRVLVRPEPRPSEADVWIRPPAELLAFLRRWHETAAGAAGASHG